MRLPTPPAVEERAETQKAFQFTPANQKMIREILKKYPASYKASAVLPLLDLAQRQEGGSISQGAIEEVARLLSMAPIRVYEVASFYTMFNLAPLGKYHVQICGTTPCWLRGAAEIKEVCERRLGIKTGAGEITSDGFFSLSEVECLGACVNAPIVQINDDYYEDLTPDAMKEILDKLSQGLPCSPGSFQGRQGSAPLGKASEIIIEPSKEKVPKKATPKTLKKLKPENKKEA